MHSAFASNVDVVVDPVPDVPVFVINAVIVGIRADAVPMTLGRAVNAYDAGNAVKTARKPIDFLKRLILLAPSFIFYYIIKRISDK